jgi:hypothetical protein
MQAELPQCCLGSCPDVPDDDDEDDDDDDDVKTNERNSVRRI